MLSHHEATEKEKREICGWKYEGEYALYNMIGYEEMQRKKFGFGNPQMYTESFLHAGKLVGFCSLFDDGDEIFFGIGVNPHLCGKGYGQEMIERMYAVSKKKFPGKPLYLEVRTWNERAINCYQKAGFVIDGDVIHQETNAGEGLFYRMVRK